MITPDNFLIVDNPVEKPVDNRVDIHRMAADGRRRVDINRVVRPKYTSFQRFDGKKRYKLINFAANAAILWKTRVSA